MKPLLFLSLVLLCAACKTTPANNAAQQNQIDGTTWTPPGPGTVVAADSMKFEEDPLNNFYFAVKLTVSSENEHANGDYGFVYDVSTHCGPGEMTGTINMPRGGKNLKPLLRHAPEGGYKYVLGFIADKNMGGDGKTFQELYAITGSKEKVEIKALKNYTFN